MSTPKLVIIADDLTGAADSAARAVRAGLEAEIWLELLPLPTSVDLVSISTDTRCLDPVEAARRLRETVAELISWSGSGVTWYKKIDSTLRGNLGAELDAMVAALPGVVAVICPAFPAQGRGMEGGSLVFAGAAPHHLPTLLKEQSSSAIGTIGLATVRQGGPTLNAALRARRERGDKLIVVDGMNDGDLDSIVRATDEPGYLLCGSAGLVEPLARRLPKVPHKNGGSSSVSAGPILAVVGSGCETAHTQVAQVEAAGTMRVRTLDSRWYEMDLVGAQSHPVGDWLLHLAPPEAGVALEGATARAQAARLADIAFAAAGKLQPSGLIVVGGDTANFVLRRLGITRLRVAEELLPGIALTYGVDRGGQRRAVVLKPGSFGDAETLLALQHAVRQRQH